MSEKELSQRAFDSALEIISLDYQPLPDGDELIQKISKKYSQLFDDPRVSELSNVVGDISIDDARSLLFCPSARQSRMYVDLLQRENSISTNFRLVILSLVYTVHRKKWAFLRDFVLAGGLNVLVSMLLEPNLYARGQACEIFLTIIDSDDDHFDWFVPYKDEIHSRTLRSCMYQKLVKIYEESFLDNIVQNCCIFEGGDGINENSFPGGSARCLQIMFKKAFWLSWVRVQFTPDQKLQLSDSLLSSLKDWAAAAEKVAESAKDNERSQCTETLSPDNENGEAKLAYTLLEDFGAAGAAKVNEIATTNGEFSDYYIAPLVLPPAMKGCSMTISLEEHLDLIAAEQDSSAASQKEIKSSSSFPKLCVDVTSQELKEKGNRHFFEEKYFHALVLYSLGISKCFEDDAQNTDLLASLYYNTASCYWKIASLCPSLYSGMISRCENNNEFKLFNCENKVLAMCSAFKEKTKNRESLLNECMEYCGKSLSLSIFHRRALHRQASAMLALGRPEEAIELIEKGLQEMERVAANTLSNKARSGKREHKKDAENEKAEIKCLHDLRRLCTARILLNEQGQHVDDKGSEQTRHNIVDSDVSSVLGKLRARQVREEKNIRHAWDGIDRSVEGTESSSNTECSPDQQSCEEHAEQYEKSHVKSKKKLKQKEESNTEDLLAFQKKCLKHNRALRSVIDDLIKDNVKSEGTLDKDSEEYCLWIRSIGKVLKSIWKAKLDLSDVFNVKSLDEKVLFAFTLFLKDESGQVSDTTKDKALSQLKRCASVAFVSSFLFSGDSYQINNSEVWKDKYNN